MILPMKSMTDKTRRYIRDIRCRSESLRSAACINLFILISLSFYASLSHSATSSEVKKPSSTWKLSDKKVASKPVVIDPDTGVSVADVTAGIVTKENTGSAEEMTSFSDQEFAEDGSTTNATSQAIEGAAEVVATLPLAADEGINPEIDESLDEGLDENLEEADLRAIESELMVETSSSAQLIDDQEIDEISVDQELAKEVDEINVLPVVDLSPALRESLKRQFALVQKIEEEEDAFSENLGEAYLAYGKLLAQAGRIDEARDMYARALHLVKVNNGVYAIEQRPVLRAMFDLYDAKGQMDEMERYLRQIIWLEKKHPDNQDDYSYDLVLRLSNLLIDHYLAWPKITEAALSRINKSIHYLTYAMKRYGDQPLREMMLPYGELALLHYFKFQISVELNRTFFDQSRYKTMADLDKSPTVLSRSNFVSSAQRNLKKYLDRATKEGDIEHQVRALRDLGDLQLLFGRSKDAANYYSMAWVRAADLDDSHELVSSFDKPSKLPDFNYAGSRTQLDKNIESVYVPLTMNLDEFGRVKKILTKADETPYPRYVFRAKRTSRKLIFRPTIDNGAMVKTPNFKYDVRLHLRPKEIARGPELP